MQKHLQEALADEFPFMRRGLSMTEQINQWGEICDLYSAFGLEVEDGWYQLIRDLCAQIVAAYEAEDVPVDLVVDQVKEKYGTLRFYYHHKGQNAPIDGLSGPVSSDLRQQVEQIVDDYEEKSAQICEDCGKPGSLRADLEWMLTLCEEHYHDRKHP